MSPTSAVVLITVVVITAILVLGPIMCGRPGMC